jgi:hypothetical protein
VDRLGDLAYRIRALFSRRAVEAELDDELRFHCEREIERHMQAGRTLQEAVRLTRLAFGGLDQVKDSCRQARGVDPLETLLRDLGYGLRMLRNHPAFAAGEPRDGHRSDRGAAPRMIAAPSSGMPRQRHDMCSILKQKVAFAHGLHRSAVPLAATRFGTL